MNINREVIKFNGRPVTVALAFPKGKPGSNERGQYVTYAVEGNKVFFASIALHLAIQHHEPGKGTLLSIARKGADGWMVKRIDPPAEQPETCERPAAQQTGSATVNSIPPEKVPYGVAFANFLTMACQAVQAAEKSSPSGSVRYDNRDVAAIATTMFIAADKAGWLTYGGPQGGE